MRVVLDASVGVKWVIRDPVIEPDLDKALALLQAIRRRSIEVVAPPHWTIEMLAVIARVRPERAAFVLGLLAALPFSETRTLSCYLGAAHLATRFSHHLFDTLYHAVALEEQATLVTADEVYFRKAKDLGFIGLLRDFAA